jgi:uncharacterized protein (TIGR02246 family)
MPRFLSMAGFLFTLLGVPCLLGQSARAQTAKTDTVPAEIRSADQQYVQARNARDYKALGEQWTEDAELVEGGRTIRRREGIIAFLRKQDQAHPAAQMKVEVENIKPLGPNLAKVTGSIRMTESESPRARWFSARFESLRVKEEGVWRIASSTVEQILDAKLDDLAWLVGNWKATDKVTGQTVEASFEKAHSGKLLLGRLSTTGKDGKVVEVLQVLQADPREGTIRCWLFESNGGRAEGFMEHDGVTYNTSLTGVPPVAKLGDKAESVQVLTPTGPDAFTWHVIERVIDGVKVPDQKPLLFRRVK